MMIVQFAGKQIAQEEISLFVQALADIVADFGVVASAVLVAFGMARKIYAAFTVRENSEEGLLKQNSNTH